MRNILVFFLLGFLVFWGLGDNYLTNWDEAWYADISRNIAQSGNIIKLIWNGEGFYDKPPLYFWLSAISMKLFGLSEFSARFPSAAAAVAAGTTLFFLARLIFDKTTAIFSVIILSSTIGFLYRARSGNLDVVLGFFILLSIFTFLEAYTKKSGRWYGFMGVALGLAFLTKGTIAFAFPIITLVFLLIKREYTVLNIRGFLGGCLLGVAISVVWILISYLVNGYGFIDRFFMNQTEKFLPNFYFWQSFSFDYILYLKSGMKAWFIFLVPALVFSILTWKDAKRKLLLIYVLVILIILSFSQNKSNWFLIPFYPMFSLMIAESIFAFRQKFFDGKFIIFFAIATIVIAVAQNVIFRNEYFVADISRDETLVALAAKSATEKSDLLYLTNYYYPTTVYYSQRKVYAVYSDHQENAAWWIRPKTDWREILSKHNVMIITTDHELKVLQESFPHDLFEEVYRFHDKLLVRKM